MQNICFKSRVSRYKDFDLVRRRSTLKDFLRFRTEKFFALSYVKWAYEKPLFNRQKKSVSLFRFEDERKDCGRFRIRRSCDIFVCKRTVFRLCVVPRSLLRACFRKAKRACGFAVFRGCKRRVFARLAHAFVCDCARNFAYRAVCDFFQDSKKRAALVGCALRSCGHDSLRRLRMLALRRLFEVRSVRALCRGGNFLFRHMRLRRFRAFRSSLRSKKVGIR